MPKIISIGNRVCLLNIREKGVLYIVGLNGMLSASWINAKSPPQRSCAMSLYIDSMACKVECMHPEPDLFTTEHLLNEAFGSHVRQEYLWQIDDSEHSYY